MYRKLFVSISFSQLIFSSLNGQKSQDIIILFIVCFHVLGIECDTRAEHVNDSFNRFNDDFNIIKYNFPKQDPRLWITLSSQVRSIIYEIANQPSCILMINNHTSKDTSQCLIKAISNSFFSAINHNNINKNVSHFKANDLPNDPIEARGKLFELIKETLKEDKVVVLEDIQDLNATTVMALHGICDEGFMSDQELKPLVLMTITDFRSEKELEKFPKEQVKISTLIKSLWEPELGVDRVYALISRISAAVTKIFTENVKFSQYC